MEYIEKIKQSINDADKVLVGIGTEFEVKEDTDKSIYHSAYNNLLKLLEGKDYYIMSLLMDDVIFDTFDTSDNIVTPLGGYRMMQCDNGCEHKLYAEGEAPSECPICQGKIVYNNLLAKTYVEEGYLDKFADYKKWLTTTINKNLCILELGANLKFPSIIRMAFDKVAYYNQKCTFYRVHETLYQHTAENGERGISVKSNSLDLMTKF